MANPFDQFDSTNSFDQFDQQDSNAFDQFDKPTGLKRAGSEATQAIDFIASIPGFVYKVGERGMLDIVAALHGDEHPMETANKISDELFSSGWRKFSMAPAESILEKFGVTTPKEGTFVHGALEKVGQAIETGAEKVADVTGSSELGALTKQVADIGMLGAGHVAGKIATKTPVESVDNIVSNLRNEVQPTAKTPDQSPLEFTKEEPSLVDQPIDFGPKKDVQTEANLPKYDGGVDYDFGGLDTSKQPELSLDRSPDVPTSDLSLIPKGKETDPRFKGNDYVKGQENVDMPIPPEADLSPVQQKLFNHDEFDTRSVPEEFNKLSMDDLASAWDNLESQVKDQSITNNASGESPASAEAINRLASQNAAGESHYIIDPERGTLTPLKTADRVDQRAPKGSAIVKFDAEGKPTILENNSRFGDTPLANRSKYMLDQENQVSPLGGVGKKQGGAITFFGKESTLEDQVKTLPKDKWIEEFNKKYPNDTAIAEQVHDRLILANKIKGSKTIGQRISDMTNGADFALGTLSTRLGNLSPRLKQQGRNFELANLQGVASNLAEVDPFLSRIGVEKGDSANVIKHDLLNGRFENLPAKAKAELPKVKTVLNRIGKNLEEYHLINGLKDNYFPRIVIDYKGLVNHLGGPQSEVGRMLEAAQRNATARGELLDDVTRSNIINDYLRKREFNQSGPSYRKGRKIDDIPPDLLKYYADPVQGLHSYIRSTTHQIETAKFFGKNLTKDPQTGKIDVATSIGKLTDDLLANGDIKLEDLPKVRELLQARFGPGQAAANIWVQTYKDVNNLTLLNDIQNTVSQAADIAPTMVINGIWPTLQSLVYQALGKNKENIKQLGLIDHVAEEFVGDRWTTQKVNQLFKATGFAQLDRFMKNVSVNAHRMGREKDADKPGSRLYRKYAEAFGPDFPQLVDDLKNKRKTQLTDRLLFSELSEHQPISKMEKTQFALENPNLGGTALSLKTFLLKQADFIRQEIYNNFKEGTKESIALGAKQAALYSLYASTTTAGVQAVKNWLLNKPQDTWEDTIWAIPRMFNLTSYLSDDLKKGDVVAAASHFAPPYQHYSDIGKEVVGLGGMAADSILGEDILNPRPRATGKILKYAVPIIGDEAYARTEAGQKSRENAESRKLSEQLGL